MKKFLGNYKEGAPKVRTFPKDLKVHPGIEDGTFGCKPLELQPVRGCGRVPPTGGPLHKIRLERPVRIDARAKGLGDYLRERFRRNNHTKYHKYCDEWINAVTPDQLHYFVQERQRIESGIVLK